MRFDLTFYSRLFVLGLITLLIGPSLIQDGMFMDGQQYACVSKNLAEGYGSWWFPYLSESWWKAGSPHFMEHPPLVYWIQASFFKLFGSGMYTERIYCFITALVTAWLIHKVWKLSFKAHPETQKWSALPIVCWIIVPVCFWGYQHNIQENTMAIFCLLSIFFFLKGEDTGVKMYLWMLISALCIVLAFLAKGPPGLFPLAIIGCYWIGYRRVSFGWMALNTGILFVMVMSIFLLITLIPAALESLTFYVNERLLFRVENEPVVTSRFSIIVRLGMEILPSIGILFFGWLLSRALKLKVEIKNVRQYFLFFLLVGFTASLPLMLTPVQRGFYLHPAWPFFGLAIAALAVPYVKALFDHFMAKRSFTTFLKTFAMATLLSGIIFTALNAGKSRRDAEMLIDVHLIGSQFEGRITLGAEQSIADKWNFRFYMMRYYGISINNNLENEFNLMPKGGEFPITQWWKKHDLPTTQYELWQRMDN